MKHEPSGREPLERKKREGVMHGRVALRGAGVTLGLALAATLFSGAQQQPAAVKTAEQQYKNIQVLKGMPLDQFNMSMHAISAELGVECVYCHVGHGNLFPLDDKPTKNTARKMIQMVMDINKNNFGGRNVVTCYTCHQGHPDPVGTITLPLPSFIETFDEPPPLTEPTADQILAKYIQALGGEQAIRKVTSRLVTATMEIPSGPGGTTPVPSQVEQYRKAPNLALNINYTPTYTVSDGFDGTTAWTQDMNGAVSDVAFAIDQVRIKRGANFYEPLDLKQEYARMGVIGVERINDREVYAVNGVPAGDSVERLYFDMRSGLLLRKVTILTTPFGNIPFQVDYDNYRDTGSGVKYPFLIHMIPATARSEAQTQSTIRVQKVQDNVDINDAKFIKPESKPAK
jgi:photosynthetic reaction center cytochrome c subunit